MSRLLTVLINAQNLELINISKEVLEIINLKCLAYSSYVVMDKIIIIAQYYNDTVNFWVLCRHHVSTLDIFGFRTAQSSNWD